MRDAIMPPPLAAYIRADLRLRAPDAGGRRRPISSGYRCNCWFGALDDTGQHTYNDAIIFLENDGILKPGDSATVRIQPAFPDLWTKVGVGTVIQLCEGLRVIGEATVIELFPSL